MSPILVDGAETLSGIPGFVIRLAYRIHRKLLVPAKAGTGREERPVGDRGQFPFSVLMTVPAIPEEAGRAVPRPPYGERGQQGAEPMRLSPSSQLAPRAGLEPATWWLTATRSTN